MRPGIVLRGVHYGYAQGRREVAVFAGMNCEFAAAESIAVLGRSGSGKSTLLNLIAGLDRPTRGSVSIDGAELTAMSDAARTRYRRRHIGIVFQFFNLVATLSVYDNLRLPLELNGVASTLHRSRIDAVLTQVALTQHAARYPEELSGGEQQRVAVARALVHAPRLLLADEPTGSLDAVNGRQIMGTLRDTARAGGHTLITVTHSLEVARYADKVVVLEDGRLSEYHDGIAW